MPFILNFHVPTSNFTATSKIFLAPFAYGTYFRLPGSIGILSTPVILLLPLLWQRKYLQPPHHLRPPRYCFKARYHVILTCSWFPSINPVTTKDTGQKEAAREQNLSCSVPLRPLYSWNYESGCPCYTQIMSHELYARPVSCLPRPCVPVVSLYSSGLKWSTLVPLLSNWNGT